MRDPSGCLIVLSTLSIAACARGVETRGTDATGGAAQAGSAASSPAAGGLRLPADRVVLTWKGGKLTYGELVESKKQSFDKLKNKYLSDLFQLEQRELQGHVLQALVAEAAGKAGKTEEAYLMAIAGEPEITKAQVETFYQQNVAQSGRPLEEVAGRIEAHLRQEKQQEAVRRELDRLKAEAGVEMSLPPPEVLKAAFVLEGRPRKGADHAAHVVVEFSDFQCPYCKKVLPAVKELVEARPSEVAVVFLQYPLPSHERAMPSAITAECAHRQGKFWPMHDRLFESQALSDADLRDHAKAVGLDLDAYDACVKDPAARAQVQADMKQGDAAGVEGTPSFYVNGIQSATGVPTPGSLADYK